MLVCDDVRREDNGKEILIGVYSSDIRVAHFPTSLRLVFWMQIIVTTEGRVRFEFRIIGPNEVQLASAGVELEVPPQAGAMGTIPLGPIPLQVQSAGNLRLEIRDRPDGRWTELKRIPVLQAEAIPAP